VSVCTDFFAGFGLQLAQAKTRDGNSGLNTAIGTSRYGIFRV
jgi:hypothetical protein